jgi:hypothetical protein
MSEEEYAPATEVANALSEFLNVVAALATAPGWQRYCLTTAVVERKQAMLQVLSSFEAVRPLLDLPSLQGPKDMARRVLDAAPELGILIAEWEGAGEPSAVMTAWASGFLAGFGASVVADPGPPPA